MPDLFSQERVARAENRRLFRERQIAQLTVEIAEAEKLLLSAQTDFQSALERKELLEQEYRAFPDTKDLNQALNLVNTEVANLAQAEQTIRMKVYPHPNRSCCNYFVTHYKEST